MKPELEAINTIYLSFCFKRLIYLLKQHMALNRSHTADYILGDFLCFCLVFLSLYLLSLSPCCFHGNLPVDGEGEEEVEDRPGQVGQSDHAWSMVRLVLWENWEACTMNWPNWSDSSQSFSCFAYLIHPKQNKLNDTRIYFKPLMC